MIFVVPHFYGENKHVTIWDMFIGPGLFNWWTPSLIYHDRGLAADGRIVPLLKHVNNSMEHIPFWEANRCSTNQDICYLLLNPQVQCRVHKCPPLNSILKQLNPVYILPSSFFKMYINVILPSTPGIASAVFPSGFPIKILYAFLFSHIRYYYYYYYFFFYLNVNFPRYVPTRHATKTYEGVKVNLLCILNLGTRWSWVVGFTSRPL
jgi:hypothetical protein